MEFAESHLQKVWNSGKQFYFLMKENVMYLDQMGVIVCGEYLGKALKKKMFVQPSNMVLVE